MEPAVSHQPPASGDQLDPASIPLPLFPIIPDVPQGATTLVSSLAADQSLPEQRTSHNPASNGPTGSRALAPGSMLDPIGDGELLEDELPWCGRYEFLKSRGYMLRPRYRPGWTASWLKAKKSPLTPEDEITLLLPNLADATRLSDGKAVFLKWTAKSSPDVSIGQFLSSEDLAKDPKNHCTPIIEVLEDQDDPDHVIIVYPLLRGIDAPRPASVRETVSLVEQTLEGLVFLHQHEVAHRDCAAANIMMDGRKLFTKGWHPQNETRLPDGSPIKDPNPSRTAAGGVRYYFIDFGIATRSQNQTVGFSGQERAPELSFDVPYDPYKLDVYILGMMYQHFLIEQCTGAGFVQPLIERMTAKNPTDRPTAAEAMEQFKAIRSGVTESQMAQRLRNLKSQESLVIRLIRDNYYRILDRWWSLKPKKELPPLV